MIIIYLFYIKCISKPLIILFQCVINIYLLSYDEDTYSLYGQMSMLSHITHHWSIVFLTVN